MALRRFTNFVLLLVLLLFLLLTISTALVGSRKFYDEMWSIYRVAGRT